MFLRMDGDMKRLLLIAALALIAALFAYGYFHDRETFLDAVRGGYDDNFNWLNQGAK